MQTRFDTPAAPIAPIAPIASPAGDPAGRRNFYVPIHKALRSFMADTLQRVGAIDVGDAPAAERTLSQLDALLTFCAEHVQHENDHVHAAMEAREPGSAARTADDHAEHVDAIDTLRAEAMGLRMAEDGAQRERFALRLYRHLALFVAENFQHMHIEETANAAALWRCYDDAELAAIEGGILATVSPQAHLLTARWMIPAMTPPERAAMVRGMKAQMPPEALLGVLEHVRPHLEPAAWEALCRVARTAEPA